MRARTVLVLLGGAALLGCSALLGVRDDVFFDENAEGGASSSGSSSSGAASSSSGGTGDGGPDGPTTCNADLQTDKQHCGRCGHSCGGGECKAGKCQPLQIGGVPNAPLQHVVTSQDHVFVSTVTTLTTQTGGIWRIPKSGGAAELYVALEEAQAMRVLGDKLFFVVEEPNGDGGPDQAGGLYTCPLVGGAPCSPARIVGAENPSAIAVDGTRVIFNDDSIGQRAFDTANSQTNTLSDKLGYYIYVDGTSIWYNFTFFGGATNTARTLEILPDGSAEIRHEFTKKAAGSGELFGTKDAIYVAAYQWEGAETGGVVHRHPRPGSSVLPCDFGGSTTNKRPFGVTVDATRIYWTNMGVGATDPFTGGEMLTCELSSCCAQGEVLWTGDGEPGGITTDQDFVYWVLEDGNVWKVAKP